MSLRMAPEEGMTLLPCERCGAQGWYRRQGADKRYVMGCNECRGAGFTDGGRLLSNAEIRSTSSERHTRQGAA